eukprot:11898443-Ditylum_brightwellii.AAC.1
MCKRKSLPGLTAQWHPRATVQMQPRMCLRSCPWLVVDSYVWIFGMLVAFTHPNVDRMLSKIDEMPVFGAWATRSAIVAICIGVLIPYYNNIYVLD